MSEVGEAGKRGHGDLCKLHKEAVHGVVPGDRLGSPGKGLAS